MSRHLSTLLDTFSRPLRGSFRVEDEFQLPNRLPQSSPQIPLCIFVFCWAIKSGFIAVGRRGGHGRTSAKHDWRRSHREYSSKSRLHDATFVGQHDPTFLRLMFMNVLGYYDSSWQFTRSNIRQHCTTTIRYAFAVLSHGIADPGSLTWFTSHSLIGHRRQTFSNIVWK